MIEFAGKGFITHFQHSNNERGLYEVIGRRNAFAKPTTIQTHQTFHEVLGRALIDNLVYLFCQLAILLSELQFKKGFFFKLFCVVPIKLFFCSTFIR